MNNNGRNVQKKKKYATNVKKGNSTPQFLLLNSTRVKKVRDYFSNIVEGLFDKLTEKNRYYLYQYNGKQKQVFLVPKNIHNLVTHLRKSTEVSHAAINLGFFMAKRDRSGFNERFYLSYEGGRFLFNIMKTHHEELFNSILKVKLDAEGEKSFLYGQNISLKRVTNNTYGLVKRRIIFVATGKGEYIGIALLKVKLIGSKEYNQSTKYIEQYSRSDNFILSLLNLADSGYYLREGN